MGYPNERNTGNLQDDRKLDGWKLVAGVLSVVALASLFVTSLTRAPNPAWSVVLIAVAVLLSAAIAIGVGRGRQARQPRAGRGPERTGEAHPHQITPTELTRGHGNPR